MDATVIIMFSMLEIAVSAILGYFMYGEAMNIRMIFGMVVLPVSMLMINEPKEEPQEAGGSSPPQA